MVRRGLAEFIATFGLVFAGGGAIVINEVSGGKVTHVGVALTFGLIITVMVYATGHISGAHINPAVTLGFAITRHFPWRRLPVYWLAQLSGAFSAALVLRGLFGLVADLGATLPSGSPTQSFALEVLLTFFLMFVIMAVATDNRAVGSSAALAIGATVGLEALFAGPISGASMNPARSFGPALAAGVLTDQWIYWLAPALGAVLGAFAYQLCRGAREEVTAEAQEPDEGG